MSQDGRPCVLVVEDEPRLRFILHRQLDEAGFDVVPQEDGLAAVRLLESLQPDLVILNVKLPGLDGFEVCRRIRADERLAHVPVLFLTVLTDPETRSRAASAGCTDYMTKPWTASELVSRVRRLTSSKSSPA